MKTKAIYLIILLLAFSFQATIFQTNALGRQAQSQTLGTSTSSEPSIQVTVKHAYYTDLDGDAYEDDVYAIVHFELSGFETFNIDYYVKLTLPSGTHYMYRVLITAHVTSFEGKNLFYNHATELGNYTLTVTAFLLNGASAYYEHVYVFDPPGSSDFGDPTFDFI